MKKTISICILATGLVLFAAALVLILRSSNQLQEEEPLPEETLVAEFETEEMIATESMTIRVPYEYVLMLEDDVLVVYLKDGKTLLFETNIRKEDLNEALLKKVDEGIYFSDDEELYAFLESYSS